MTFFNPRNLIEQTGKFNTRIPKAVPPQNYIRPLVRYSRSRLLLRLAARRIPLLAAFMVGLEIGFQIRQPVRNWFVKLLDPSQPTTYIPEKEPRPVSFEVPYTPGVSFSYEVETTQTNIESSRFKCSNNERVEKGSTTVTSNTYKINKAYGLRYSTDVAIKKLVCSGGTGPSIEKNILLVETADADGEWSIAAQTVGKEGTETSQFYYDSEDKKSQAVPGVQQDGKPLVVPSPFVEPYYDPIPNVEPETLPQRLPEEKPKVVPQPAIIPDAEPLPDTSPQPLPAPAPLPVLPAVSPQVQPATQPKETQTTTKAGAIVPKTPKKTAVTPKDVHVFGNSGGRVAGRTMRPTATGIAQEVGRIEQKIAGMNSGFPSVGGLADILRLILGLNELLNSQKDGTTYELNSVCECDPCDETCEEETTIIETDGGYYVDAILSRIDAIPQLIQAHKDYRQPVCDERPCTAGDFRTISFISDECSPFGNSRLRKRFRYRSQSGVGLDGLVDHWKDFTWSAGAVCVQHKGASWGTPQCWASSSDEGKRVILHAGGEAGIDPNKVGEWIVSGSNNPRYGVSGTMRVNTKGGYYWITERLDSDARPLVAST
jgi:hypothetical protein